MKKWPKLEEVIAIMPRHGHIKDQVVWEGSIYDFEGYTTLGPSALLVNCHITLNLNDAETRDWIKKGGLKKT